MSLYELIQSALVGLGSWVIMKLMLVVLSAESRGGVVLNSPCHKNDELSWREGVERNGWVIFTLINLVWQLKSPLKMCIISTNGNTDKSSSCQVLLCVYNQTGWTQH